ncbi:hypothetical protein ACVW0J_007787 [Bradyrhizobium sp. i1.7.7]
MAMVASLSALISRLPPALTVAPEATLVVAVPSILPTTTPAATGVRLPSKVEATAGSDAVSVACAEMVTSPRPLMSAWLLMLMVAVALAAT